MESKKEIRQQIYQLRKQMEESRWREMSEQITRSVIRHPWYDRAKDIYIYMDYRHEVGTRSMIEEAWKKGKSVWVPKVIGTEMYFCRINSFDALRPGAYGILEPVGEPDTYEVSEPEGILQNDKGKLKNRKLMIMPGVAFDVHGNRIGYGGGYYDRYLAVHPEMRRMAVAFDYQIFPELPGESHDIRPEVIITERRLFYAESSAQGSDSFVKCSQYKTPGLLSDTGCIM